MLSTFRQGKDWIHIIKSFQLLGPPDSLVIPVADKHNKRGMDPLA